MTRMALVAPVRVHDRMSGWRELQDFRHKALRRP